MKKLITLLFIISLSLFLSGCTKEGEVVDNTTMTDNSQTTKIEADRSCEGETGQKSCPKAGEQVVKLSTNYGDITLKLFTNEAPKTTENFLKLVKEGFYNGLTFHRVISGFMIQGGDPSGDGTGGPGYTVPAEITDNLSHIAGALATARQSDAVNPEKASSGSQFYIVHDDYGAKGLDGEYTIFGQVVAGQNIVNKIAEVDTNQMDKPLDDVVIESATVEDWE